MKKYFIFFIFTSFFLSLPKPTRAASYYVSPSGSDSNNGTSASPWKSIKTSIGKLQSNDILILKDGTYYESIYLYNRTYLTIKAENDGKAVLDDVARNASPYGGCIHLIKSSYINIEGVYAKNCDDVDHEEGWPVWVVPELDRNGYAISGTESHHVNLRRVTARNAHGAWSPVFNITGSTTTGGTSVRVNNILIEDCASYGFGIHGILISQDTSYVTVRRFFNLWEGWDDSTGKWPWCQNVEMYGGDHNTLENIVVFTKPDSSLYTGGTFSPDAPCVQRSQTSGTSATPRYDAATHGFIIPGQNQKLLGSIVYKGKGDSFYGVGCTNCTFKDIVSINSINRDTSGLLCTKGQPCPQMGFGISRDKSGNNFSALVENFTWVSNEKYAYGAFVYNKSGSITNSPSNSLSVKNSFFQTTNPVKMLVKNADPQNLATFNHSYNKYSVNNTNPYENTAAGTGEGPLSVNWDTNQWGDGAYLIASKTNLKGIGENGKNIGADVIYQYENGVITSKPLWPWPMEERIKKESGVSVTWEANGGLWKTLDGVYEGDVPCPLKSLGDFNCDGKINESDLNALLGKWMTNEKDITGDGKVNESDLNKLLGNWKT
ncbi:hypothetical protein MUP32_01275 [Candidatus Microgenomates bacterium]|nr:hypothetical protein [Candidatus Microgenomates bacterium]